MSTADSPIGIEIRIKDQTGEETMFKIKRTTKMEKVFKTYASRKGVDEEYLAFLIEGEKIDIDDTPQSLRLEDGDSIDCVLKQSGMISTFTSNDTTDALINYLMLADEERVTATIPIAELRSKRRMEGGRHKQFTYKQNPDILHPSQLAVLCELLDFVWDKTAVTGEVRVDMRLTLTSDQLVAVRAHECMMICACNYYHTIYVLYVHTPYNLATTRPHSSTCEITFNRYLPLWIHLWMINTILLVLMTSLEKSMAKEDNATKLLYE